MELRLYKYQDKKIRIETVSGKIFEGIADLYTQPCDNYPDEVESICIGNIEFTAPEIKSIEIIR